MPLYEYSCRECGHRFETLVIGKRVPPCPRCGAKELEKLHSAFRTRSSGSSAPAFGGRRFT